MSQLLEARRSVRRRVKSLPKYDIFLHRFITVVLTVNMVLILYALISVTFGMTLNGVNFVDSLPLAFYILPMMIILPIMIRAYYLGRTAAWNFVFLMICTVFFGMLSLLVRGFIICLAFNIIAAVALFFMGRFRPEGKLRAAGKKVIAYFIFVNLLGLAFPISTILMGQNPIATTTVIDSPQIKISVPLADFDYPYQNITPTPQLLSDVLDNNFLLDLHVLENDPLSWTRLRTWLVALNDTAIGYSITLTADRAQLAGEDPQTLATTDLIEDVYESHGAALNQIMNVEIIDTINAPYLVLFDMTLSGGEWRELMLRTRNLDLIGFGGLMRTSIYSVDIPRIENASTILRYAASASGIPAGLLVDTFVIDDMLDGDSIAMRLCGLTSTSLQQWQMLSVSCSRSRFSFEMRGDVGEYLVHSYSSSVASRSSYWSLRLGEVGNSTDVLDRTDSVYDDLVVVANDIALAAGNGVEQVTLESLPSLLSAFGDNALSSLRSVIDGTEQGIATYTFRIYAFRAVFLAIDAFDLIML
ncbi:MAG: hypothetical protein ThorAB25_07070 [Candidatus Thorarchaeota archaeon AB_25]|nr:MAG: hypothetical protein ThorAB25_07070 [Candidatus Thorarchaeota archaeon AB_25]